MENKLKNYVHRSFHESEVSKWKNLSSRLFEDKRQLEAVIENLRAEVQRLERVAQY